MSEVHMHRRMFEAEPAAAPDPIPPPTVPTMQPKALKANDSRTPRLLNPYEETAELNDLGPIVDRIRS